MQMILVCARVGPLRAFAIGAGVICFGKVCVIYCRGEAWDQVVSCDHHDLENWCVVERYVRQMRENLVGGVCLYVRSHR